MDTRTNFLTCGSYGLVKYAQGSLGQREGQSPLSTENKVALQRLVGVLHQMTLEQPHERPTIADLLARLRPLP